MFFTKKNVHYSIPNFKLNRLLLAKVQYVFDDIDYIKKHSDLFAFAKEIWIYAGELYSEFYNEKHFINSIRKSLEAGCKIRAVFGAALYVNTADFLRLAFSFNTVKLYRRPYRDPAHFRMIEDWAGNTFLFVDKRHGIDDGKEERTTVLLTEGYDKEIIRFKAKFERELEKTQEINVHNIIDVFSDMGKRDGEFYGFITKKNGKAQLASDDQIQHLKQELLCCHDKNPNTWEKFQKQPYIVDIVDQKLSGTEPTLTP